MPRDKTGNHEKIINAAFMEFLDHGYQDASMRRIAAACGMSVSGLYKHFPSKEEMFAGLVDPVIDGFMELYREIEDDYGKELETKDKESLWVDQRETIRAMEYIYDHFDEFKLIICRSQGTRYENFTHDMAEIEEEVTFRYMKELKKKGTKVNEVSNREFHLLVTTNVEALFQAVVHDFSREEAMHYARTLEQFYMPAWKALFGLQDIE